jgi:hypothetical protein
VNATPTTPATASPIIVRVGPNKTRIEVANRTPRAVVAAARRSVNLLSIDDLRALANMSRYEVESVWDDLSIIGVLSIWIGCALLDVEFATGLDESEDQKFVDRLRAIAPRLR